MQKGAPDFKPIDLDQIGQFGWPWHQQIKLAGGHLAYSGQGGLTLTDGTFVKVNEVIEAHNTFLFDVGRDDPETTNEIENLGGKWWGKAVVRFNDSGQCFYGGGLALPGIPFWLPGLDPPHIPIFGSLAIVTDGGSGHYLYWNSTNAGVPVNLFLPLSLESMGQGEGQPDCLVFLRSSPSSLGVPTSYTMKLLDVYQNKALIGIVAVSDGAIAKQRPSFTVPPDGFAPSAWHRQLLGLMEVTVVSKGEIQVALLEDRESALGSPNEDLIDDPGPNDGRNYRKEVAVTDALLAAWYTSAGAIQKVRYDHVELSTLLLLIDEDSRSYEMLFNSKITLKGPSGAAVDEIEVSQHIESYSRYSGSQYTVTTWREGEDENVATKSWDGYVGFAIVTPIELMAVGEEQMQLSLPGRYINAGDGTNELDNQSVHSVWISRLCNKAAALCYTHELAPYPDRYPPYPPPLPSVMSVESGPAVSPAGVHGARTVRTITAPLEFGPDARRIGFLNFKAYPFTLGSFNPVTGTLVRNDPDNFLTWA